MTIAFVATLNTPGDPLAGLLPDNPTPEQYAQARREFGLDEPGAQQWLHYVTRTATGDLGRSLRTRKQVNEDLGRAATATLELSLIAFAITGVVGVTLGVLSAASAGRPLDHALNVVTAAGAAAPIFWTAIMAQLVFYAWLQWLPPGGRIDEYTFLLSPFPERTGAYLVDSIVALDWPALASVLAHLLLPAVILAYRAVGLVVRITRSAMIEALHADYTRTARAFGARQRRIVWFHSLRNALPPVLTVLGLAFGELLTGSLLVETVFSWPGLGLYTFQSITSLDYPGVIGVSLLITLIYLIANLLIDLAYPIVDPRMRALR